MSLQNQNKASGSASRKRPRRLRANASTAQVAAAFEVSPRVVQLWARRYGCPHRRRGRALAFDLEQVRRWRASVAAPRRARATGAPDPAQGDDVKRLADQVERLALAVEQLARLLQIRQGPDREAPGPVLISPFRGGIVPAPVTRPTRPGPGVSPMDPGAVQTHTGARPPEPSAAMREASRGDRTGGSA